MPRRLTTFTSTALVGSALVVSLRKRGADLRAARAAAASVRRAAVQEAAAEVVPPAEPFVAIVVPALNEEDSIGAVLDAVPDTVCDLPVLTIVVDDGSEDATASIAAKHGAAVVRHRRNLGQGDGLRSGFEAATALGAFIAVTMDADGQHDPAELPDLVKPILNDEADYVQGSRFLGRYDDAGSARHAGIRGFTLLINAVARTHITDCTNGYRAIRVSGLSRMRLVEGRFNASEIIIEAAARGLRLVEVPVHIRARAVGESRKPGGLGYPVGYGLSIFRSWARAHAGGAQL